FSNPQMRIERQSIVSPHARLIIVRAGAEDEVGMGPLRSPWWRYEAKFDHPYRDTYETPAVAPIDSLKCSQSAIRPVIINKNPQKVPKTSILKVYPYPCTLNI